MITQERIHKARQADLVAVLQAHGEELQCVNHSKGEYRVKGHQGLMVCGNHYYLHSNGGVLEGQQRGDGNNALTFVMSYYNMDFNSAVDYLNGFNQVSIEMPQNAPERSYTARYDKAYAPTPATDYRRVMAYLVKTRGISADIVRDFLQRGLLLQDDKGNACWRCTDFETGETVGWDKRGTYTNVKEPFKQCKVCSGFGFNFKCGEPKAILFFEGVTDLISYYQIFKGKLTHHWLVCMHGLKDGVVQNIHSLHPEMDMAFCIDNDESGTDFFKRMLEIYPKSKRHSPENCKDWNDFLRTNLS